MYLCIIKIAQIFCTGITRLHFVNKVTLCAVELCLYSYGSFQDSSRCFHSTGKENKEKLSSYTLSQAEMQEFCLADSYVNQPRQIQASHENQVC